MLSIFNEMSLIIKQSTNNNTDIKNILAPDLFIAFNQLHQLKTEINSKIIKLKTKLHNLEQKSLNYRTKDASSIKSKY